MRACLLALLLVLLLPALAVGLGNTYYVSKPTSTPAGNDSNPCTANTSTVRRATLNAGAACLGAGDTLVVGSGEYNESLLDKLPSGLSDTQRTILKSEVPRGAVMVTDSAGTSAWCTICIVGRSYITIDGLVFDGRNTNHAAHVYLNSGPQYINIFNNELKNGTGRCACCDNPMGIADNPAYHTNFTWVKGNYFHHISLGGCAPGTTSGYGMYYHGEDSTIEDNEFAYNAGYALHNYNSGAGTAAGINSRNIYRRNLIHHNGQEMQVGAVLIASEGDNNEFSSNVVYSNLGGGVGIAGYGSPTANNNHVWGNTIWNNTGNCMTLGSSGSSQPTATIIQNNICWGNNTDDIVQVGGSGTVKDHNHLAAQGNPNFASTVEGNAQFLRLSSSSTLAIDHGADLSSKPGLTIDAAGNTRPVGAGWDIGAYEFGGTTAPPTNPLGWWKCEEGSGTTVADSSGNGHTATLVGGVTFGTAKVGSFACVCNGTTGELDVTGLIADTGGYSAVSLTVWANVPALNPSGSGSEIISLGDYVALHLDAGQVVGIFTTATGGNQGVVVPASLINTGWHHYAWVVDPGASSEKLYIDGTLRSPQGTAGGSLAWTGAGTDTRLCMHGNGNTAKRMQGSVDEAKVWGRALSAADVAAEYGYKASARHRTLGMR